MSSLISLLKPCWEQSFLLILDVGKRCPSFFSPLYPCFTGCAYLNSVLTLCWNFHVISTTSLELSLIFLLYLIQQYSWPPLGCTILYYDYIYQKAPRRFLHWSWREHRSYTAQASSQDETLLVYIWHPDWFSRFKGYRAASIEQSKRTVATSSCMGTFLENIRTIDPGFVSRITLSLTRK